MYKQFKLKKARNGDQELVAKMVSLEIVASSILIKEIHKFVSFEDMCLYALSSKLYVKLSSHFLTFHQNKSTIIK